MDVELKQPEQIKYIELQNSKDVSPTDWCNYNDWYLWNQIKVKLRWDQKGILNK